MNIKVNKYGEHVLQIQGADIGTEKEILALLRAKEENKILRDLIPATAGDDL